MSMLASRRRIGSAYFVHCGRYGDVQRFARQQGVSRQWVYREARQVAAVLEGRPTQQAIERWRSENQTLRAEVAQLQQRLSRAVELDDAKQEEFAGVGQACGVTLSRCRTLLEVLIAGQTLSVASLGRRTHAAGAKAGPLLAVLDAVSRPLVRDAAADEIYVNDPVLMVVEQARLCWVTGQRSVASAARRGRMSMPSCRTWSNWPAMAVWPWPMG